MKELNVAIFILFILSLIVFAFTKSTLTFIVASVILVVLRYVSYKMED
jgi:hypothetical protein